MLFTVRNSAFCDVAQKNIRISKNKKYGLINETNNTAILPKEYDNIFLYGVDIFALYKNGKVGLCKIEDEKAVILCECKYDVIDNFNTNLFLSNDSEICYYNSQTKQTMIFKEANTDMKYLYGCDNEYQYIIHQDTGSIIYKKKFNKYNKSCYVYCGDTDNGAVFYDATFSTYIYPTDEGYKPYEYSLNQPIIVNKYNVINIIDGEQGIGIIDCKGNTITENKYDEITVEIKITAKNQKECLEKIIPLPNGNFDRETVNPIEDWI